MKNEKKEEGKEEDQGPSTHVASKATGGKGSARREAIMAVLLDPNVDLGFREEEEEENKKKEDGKEGE